ncbi:MAG: response regulator, partial [Planctomycetes bacterium]|nr:response regulator [Planctomycetota bacterium]
CLLGAVGIFRDMSEYETMIEQLTHVHKMEAVGQLAGGVAHDLNNMLGGIIGAAELIKFRMQSKELPDIERLVNLIFESSERAADLTSNLLSFSRKGKIVSSPVSLQDIIESTIAIAEPTIDKRIELTADLPEGEIQVIGDPAQLQNALLNLIINARDALPSGGKIRISLDTKKLDKEWCDKSAFDVTPGEYACIRVEDNGTGIAPELQKRIFEPFFTTKAEGKGTGLGLASVYGAINSHHGALTLESEIDKGSTFRILLPLSHETRSHETQNELPAPQGMGTVLIVDDEMMLRTTAKLMLEDCGYKVFVAGDAEEGIETYKKNADKIDIVLLDMVMPKMNGAEVYAELSIINPEVKVIMTSGFTQNEHIPQGIAAFIKKPYRRGDLSNAIYLAMNS